MNDLSVFNFVGGEVRIVRDKNGEPHWVAKDIAEALGYVWNPWLVSHIPDAWKSKHRIVTLGGVQEMITLSEQGLYFFLGRSNKPAALPMQKWIAGEVLPSIRKTGSYSMQIPQTLPEALIAYAEALLAKEGAEKQLVVAEKQIEHNAPKVQYHDAVMNCEGQMPVFDSRDLDPRHGEPGVALPRPVRYRL